MTGGSGTGRRPPRTRVARRLTARRLTAGAASAPGCPVTGASPWVRPGGARSHPGTMTSGQTRSPPSAPPTGPPAPARRRPGGRRWVWCRPRRLRRSPPAGWPGPPRPPVGPAPSRCPPVGRAAAGQPAHPLTIRLRTGGRAPALLTGGPRPGRPVIRPAPGPALGRLTGRVAVGYRRSGSQRTGGQTGPARPRGRPGPATSPGAAGPAGCCCWRWPGRCWSSRAWV